MGVKHLSEGGQQKDGGGDGHELLDIADEVVLADAAIHEGAGKGVETEQRRSPPARKERGPAGDGEDEVMTPIIPSLSSPQKHPRSFAEQLVGSEWADWYSLSPEARLAASQQLWTEYLALRGSLEPEVDFQSPFYTPADYWAFAQSSSPLPEEP